MRTRILALGAWLGLALGGAAGAAAQATDSSLVHYDLGPNSSYETGCFGPCECPVFLRSLKGTFDLQRVGIDPLFTYYRVSNVHWVTSDANTNLAILGSGTYKVGGEFAIQHELSLNLSIGGGAPLHFDSGLVPGQGEFPKIDITISLHQNSACLDTVMRVQAAPDPPSSAYDTFDPPKAPAAEAAPNPFHGETAIRLFLPRAGDLEVAIYDARGRAVRRLTSGTWFDAGPHTLWWDGQPDRGPSCASGVYFVRVGAGGDRAIQRIVKVR